MQNNNNINIMFIADIVGKPGLEITRHHINNIIDENNIHLVIANGENGASGKGLTEKILFDYFDMGINIITSGNHIWNKKEIFPFMDTNSNILRPLNYPPNLPGQGTCIFKLSSGIKIAVINLQGRTFMQSIDCPFRVIDKEICRLNKIGIKIILIDFHAEATAEKIALGWFLDGRVSALIGTHTHVQTADEQILPNGTAYISDIGMTGSFNSVIGMNKEIAIKRFIEQIPYYYKIAYGDEMICGVCITIDSVSSRANSIKRFQLS